nr:YncE family protein [Cupriavidus sp. P-10]
MLLLIEKSAHTFSIYDAETGEVVRRIPMPAGALYPHEFVVDSSRRYAYIGHYGVQNSGIEGVGGNRIFVIDLKQMVHVRTLRTDAFYRIHGLAMDDQDRLYALSETQGAVLIFDDPSRSETPNRAVPTGGYKSHLVALTRDGKQAFSMNLLSNTVTYFKPHDPAFVPVVIKPGRKPEGNCLSRDERTLYVTNRNDNTVVAIDIATQKITGSAATGKDPTRVYLAPDGRLFVSNYGENSISLFDAVLKPVGHIALPAQPIAVSFHPLRPMAYVSLTDDTLGMLDLATLRFTRFVKTLAEPDVSMVIVA